jgi:hypothetical protein
MYLQQILAKVEYKSPQALAKNAAPPESPNSKDKKLMPPPLIKSEKPKKNDPKIRIQAGKENVRELRNWCFKINDAGSICIQGVDLA